MVEAKFLYPTSRQFPFDEAAETIVRELTKRNWNIPGMKVTITRHGSGEDKYDYVESVEGEDFRLEFGINRCMSTSAKSVFRRRSCTSITTSLARFIGIILAMIGRRTRKNGSCVTRRNSPK